MEPIISHRCQTCGAATRVGVTFCPQCGAEVSKSVGDVPSNDMAPVTETPNAADDTRPKRGSTAPTQPFKPIKRTLPFVGKSQAGDQEVAQPDAVTPETPSKPIVAGTSGHSKTQRVKDAARGIVDENVRPRVEKLRHASSVVLEEASAIDPSLRFVLIAIFLFIIFIVLLALSFIR